MMWGEWHMDFKELAQEQVLWMIHRAPPHAETAQKMFSNGEVRMVGFLYCGHDGVTAGELSALLGVSTARVAATLKSLEKKEIVCRRRDPKDHRRVLVYLTPHGQDEAEARFSAAVSFLAEAYSRLGEADTREFLRLSHRMDEIAEQLHCDGKEKPLCEL